MSRTTDKSREESGSPWRVLAVVLASTVVGASILAGFLLWPKLVGASEAVSERERRMLIVAGDFEPWTPKLVIHGGEEHFTKRRYDDTAATLAYRYDHTHQAPAVFVQSELHVAGDLRSASAYFKNRATSPLPFDRVARTPQDTVFEWGDESAFGELRRENEVCGRYFVGRAGDRVYSVTTYGVSTDFPDQFVEMLLPLLNQIDSFEPRSTP
jgi:hypothetical protein